MSIDDERPERTDLMVMFRILTRRDWGGLQKWHEKWHATCPGLEVEHLYAGLYVLRILPAGEATA